MKISELEDGNTDGSLHCKQEGVYDKDNVACQKCEKGEKLKRKDVKRAPKKCPLRINLSTLMPGLNGMTELAKQYEWIQTILPSKSTMESLTREMDVVQSIANQYESIYRAFEPISPSSREYSDSIKLVTGRPRAQVELSAEDQARLDLIVKNTSHNQTISANTEGISKIADDGRWVKIGAICGIVSLFLLILGFVITLVVYWNNIQGWASHWLGITLPFVFC